MDYKVFCSTKDMDHADWLKARRNGIGGSDAAAIVGLSPYSSPLSVYAHKMELVPPIDDNEAMRQGRDFEDYVAKRFEEASGLKTRRRNAILQHPEHDWMLANVDRLIVGENAGLECKTTSVYNRTDFDGGNIPPYYYAQCQHYMAVTGAEKWYLAVLILNRKFHWFEIQRNDDDIAALISAEKVFWEEHVLGQIPPEPNENDSDLLKDLYPQVDEAEEVTLYHIEDTAKNLVTLKAQINELDKEKKRLENVIKGELGSAGVGIMHGFKIKYSDVVSSRFNSKELKKDNPDLYSKYVKESTSRRLTIKEAI